MLSRPPDQTTRAFTTAEMAQIASDTNQFTDCMQNLNYQLQPKISACLSLDAGSQEFIRTLTSSQSRDQCKHGGDHSNSDTDDEESYESALQNLHQNLDEKVAIAKRMLQIAREKSSEMQQILTNVKTLQDRAKSSGHFASVETAVASTTLKPSIDSTIGNQRLQVNPNVIYETKSKSSHRAVAKPKDSSRSISQSRAVKNKIKKLKNSKSRVKVSKQSLQSGIADEVLKLQNNSGSKSKKKPPIAKCKANVDASNNKKTNSGIKQEAEIDVDLSKGLADSDETVGAEVCSEEPMQVVESSKPEPDVKPEDADKGSSEQRSNDDSDKESSAETSSSKVPGQAGNTSSCNSNSQSNGGNGSVKSPSKQLTKSYCVCKEPFNSDMVACDNRHCKIEWFHFR